MTIIARTAPKFCAHIRAALPEICFSRPDIFGNFWNHRTLARMSTWRFGYPAVGQIFLRKIGLRNSGS